jgi:hypothetical protein
MYCTQYFGDNTDGQAVASLCEDMNRFGNEVSWDHKLIGSYKGQLLFIRKYLKAGDSSNLCELLRIHT